MISAPPGACAFALTRPVTWITVSSGRSPAPVDAARSLVSTAWARPVRSRTIRNVTDFSWRLRCSQPATATCSPTFSPRPAARTRFAVMRHFPWLDAPLGSAGEKGTRCATALSPPARGRSGLISPVTGASRRGIEPAAGQQRPFLPALGSVFTTGREAAISAAGGSLGSRFPALLVSVSALAPVYRRADALPFASGSLLVKGARSHVRILPAARSAVSGWYSARLRPERPVR